MYQKDGVPYTLAALRARHPNVSFSENTPQELGYVKVGYTTPEETPTQRRARLKRQRTHDISTVVVQTTSGKVFDGDEESQRRMLVALQIAEITGRTETPWVLADNTLTMVTLPELREALVLAGLRQSELWPLPEG